MYHFNFQTFAPPPAFFAAAPFFAAFFGAGEAAEGGVAATGGTVVAADAGVPEGAPLAFFGVFLAAAFFGDALGLLDTAFTSGAAFFGLEAFFLAGVAFLEAAGILSPRRKDPEAPVPFLNSKIVYRKNLPSYVCLRAPLVTPRFNAWRRCALI